MHFPFKNNKDLPVMKSLLFCIRNIENVLIRCFIINFLFVLFMLISSIAYGDENDSLKILLKKCKDPCHSSDLCNLLSEKNILTNSDSAIFYSQLAIKFSERCGVAKTKANSFLNNGTALDVSGRYTEAYESATKAIKIFKDINDKEGEARSLYRLGKISFHQSECTSEEGRIDYYNEALANYKSAYRIAKELNDTFNIANNQIEIGRVMLSLNKPDSALKILNDVLAVCEKKSSDPRFLHNVAKSSYNIALVYIQKDSLDKATEFLFKAAATDSILNNKEGVALIRAAEIYLKLGKYDKAYYLAKKSLDTAIKYGYSLRIFQANEILYKVFEKKSDYKNAYYSLLNYKQMNDSLKDDKYIKEITRIKLQTEYEAKQKQEQIEHRAKLERQKLITYSVIIVLILLVAFLVYGIHTYRQKQKANRLLAKQNAEIMQQKEEISSQRDEIEAQRDVLVVQKDHIEEQKKEIEDSIHYAKRIQNAVLPDKNNTLQILKDHFIIFRPKDVVSGDFFWTTQINNWLIATAADCTGHGVPGAFMSMLGMSFLNEIVRKKEVTNAAEILNHLRASVVEALKQTGESGTQKDGMDISIIVINRSENVFYWAGANNPLYLVTGCPSLATGEVNQQPEASNLQLIEIKADKMPVAIHERMDSFTNHELKLQEGDRVYLFTDGMPDQFGGPKGKKFMHKQLKGLIADTSQLPMRDQGIVIEQALDKWIKTENKNYEQVDDITVLGIRI